MLSGFWQGCCSDISSWHVGFFCSRSRTFHFYWTLWSVSWPSPQVELCPSSWSFAIWHAISSSYFDVICEQLSCITMSLSRSLVRCWLSWPQNWPLQGCPHCWLPAGQKPLITECPSSLGFKQFSAPLTPSRQYFLLEGMKNTIQLSRFNCFMLAKCWKLVYIIDT